jgi:hypothetical protein
MDPRHSFYRGGILGDPFGLGKSLTVALFAVRFLRQYPRVALSSSSAKNPDYKTYHAIGIFNAAQAVIENEVV